MFIKPEIILLKKNLPKQIFVSDLGFLYIGLIFWGSC